MLTNICSSYLEIAQKDIVQELNDFSKTRPVVGRLGAVPIAVVDVALEAFKSPISALEQLVVAVINVVGFIFTTKCSLKDAILSSEVCVVSTLKTPVSMLFSPIKLVYQLFFMVIDPATAKSIETNIESYKIAANIKGVLLPVVQVPAEDSQVQLRDVR